MPAMPPAVQRFVSWLRATLGTGGISVENFIGSGQDGILFLGHNAEGRSGVLKVTSQLDEARFLRWQEEARGDGIRIMPDVWYVGELAVPGFVPGYKPLKWVIFRENVPDFYPSDPQTWHALANTVETQLGIGYANPTGRRSLWPNAKAKIQAARSKLVKADQEFGKQLSDFAEWAFARGVLVGDLGMAENFGMRGDQLVIRDFGTAKAPKMLPIPMLGIAVLVGGLWLWGG